jgi:hypothetical protein
VQRVPRLGRPQGARRAARRHPKQHPHPPPLGDIRRRHPAESGTDRRPDARQLHRRGHPRGRSRHSGQVALRTARTRLLSHHPQRAKHRLCHSTQPADPTVSTSGAPEMDELRARGRMGRGPSVSATARTTLASPRQAPAWPRTVETRGRRPFQACREPVPGRCFHVKGVLTPGRVGALRPHPAAQAARSTTAYADGSPGCPREAALAEQPRGAAVRSSGYGR